MKEVLGLRWQVWLFLVAAIVAAIVNAALFVLGGEYAWVNGVAVPFALIAAVLCIEE